MTANTAPNKSLAATQLPAPRPAILHMPEYHPPLAHRDALRLDFNENTLAPSPKVLEAVRALTAESFTKYPEREPMEIKVAAYLNLDHKQVILTNAVDEAIHLIAFTFLNIGDEAIVATPSFFMYDVAIGSMGATLTRVQADDSLIFPFDRFLAAITSQTKLIILSTPNNPTGTTLTRAQIHTIAKAAPQAVIFVDEAYFHFFGETVLNDLDLFPNILVARTFSKVYGLANLRIGLIAGHADLVKHIRKAASPYNVNGVAIAALDAALTDDAYVNWYADQIRAGREQMAAGIAALNVPQWPSHANFILMRIGKLHKEFVLAMKSHGVLVRDRSTDPGLEGCVRITIGPTDHVAKGLAALKQSLLDINWKLDPPTAPATSTEEPEYE